MVNRPRENLPPNSASSPLHALSKYHFLCNHAWPSGHRCQLEGASTGVTSSTLAPPVDHLGQMVAPQAPRVDSGGWGPQLAPPRGVPLAGPCPVEAGPHPDSPGIGFQISTVTDRLHCTIFTARI
jgi:hypothetical protein